MSLASIWESWWNQIQWQCFSRRQFRVRIISLA
jgi:hypothetical protein